jgi:hypothetical protein
METWAFRMCLLLKDTSAVMPTKTYRSEISPHFTCTQTPSLCTSPVESGRRSLQVNLKLWAHVGNYHVTSVIRLGKSRFSTIYPPLSPSPTLLCLVCLRNARCTAGRTAIPLHEPKYEMPPIFESTAWLVASFPLYTRLQVQVPCAGTGCSLRNRLSSRALANSCSFFKHSRYWQSQIATGPTDIHRRYTTPLWLPSAHSKCSVIGEVNPRHFIVFFWYLGLLTGLSYTPCVYLRATL